MYGILLTACLSLEPSNCKVVNLYLMGVTTKKECIFQGIAKTNNWGKTNKGWYIRRWECVNFEQKRNI
jgi:hypothetical protein